MPKGKRVEETPADLPAINPKERWVMTIQYLSGLGTRATAIRYFERRADCEFAIKEIILHGLTAVGGDVISVVPPHMVQGVTFYDQMEGRDASS
jgi:hypothetical protein